MENIEATPVFESSEEYERFRCEFAEAMLPVIREQKIARARAEVDIMSKPIG